MLWSDTRRRPRISPPTNRCRRYARETVRQVSQSQSASSGAREEVNDILRAFHPDTAALRRYLVDDEFLERRDAVYWRAGGTFDIDAD